MKNKLKKLIILLKQLRTRSHRLDITFIISTGRTGTNFFEDFLNQNFDFVHSVHEPKPDMFGLGIEFFRRGMSEDELITNMVFHRLKHLENAIKKNKKFYLESNPFLSYLAPYINKAFPNAKIIHIVRHPDSYILSAINKDPDNSGRYFMTDQDHRNRLNTNDFEAEKSKFNWSNMNQFERVCWNWAFINKHVYSHLHQNPNYLQVKFEDIFIDEPKLTYNKLCSFIGIKEFERFPQNQIIEKLSNKKNSTATRIVENLQEEKKKNSDFYNRVILAEELELFGY